MIIEDWINHGNALKSRAVYSVCFLLIIEYRLSLSTSLKCEDTTGAAAYANLQIYIYDFFFDKFDLIEFTTIQSDGRNAFGQQKWYRTCVIVVK